MTSQNLPGDTVANGAATIDEHQNSNDEVECQAAMAYFGIINAKGSYILDVYLGDDTLDDCESSVFPPKMLEFEAADMSRQPRTYYS